MDAGCCGKRKALLSGCLDCPMLNFLVAMCGTIDRGKALQMSFSSNN